MAGLSNGGIRISLSDLRVREKEGDFIDTSGADTSSSKRRSTIPLTARSGF